MPMAISTDQIFKNNYIDDSLIVQWRSDVFGEIVQTLYNDKMTE